MNLKKAYGKVNRREFWKAMQVYEIEKPLGYFGKSMREVGKLNLLSLSSLKKRWNFLGIW